MGEAQGGGQHDRGAGGAVPAETGQEQLELADVGYRYPEQKAVLADEVVRFADVMQGGELSGQHVGGGVVACADSDERLQPAADRSGIDVGPVLPQDSGLFEAPDPLTLASVHVLVMAGWLTAWTILLKNGLLHQAQPRTDHPTQARGAEPAIADIEDRAAMAPVLSAPSPARVFALNPPGSITADPDADEDRTANAIIDALDTAQVERVVALSTYGAQPGHHIGDLGTLYRFEELLQALAAPVAIVAPRCSILTGHARLHGHAGAVSQGERLLGGSRVRAGYLYSNWDGAAETARSRGEVAVMLDPDRPLPMVAPADVGEEAARLLMLDEPHQGVSYVEGPHRYTPQEVAKVFTSLLHTPVVTVRTPQDQWKSTFLAGGFSTAAADSFTGLTTLANRETWELDAPPTLGSITLQAYISALLNQH